MRYDAAQIRSFANDFVSGLGYADISKIPAQNREAASIGIARKLGITPTEVKVALASDWNERAGLAGQGVAGSKLAATSSTAARSSGGVQQLQVRFGELEKAPVAKPLSGAQAVDAALRGGAAAKIQDLPPTGFGPSMLRRGAALDKHLPGVAVGAYGAIDPTRIPKDDPILDAPIYRGMGSQDPAVHALLLTGRMIPQGRGSDYEGFKRYDHKTALDAYEWSFDPYVALKATAGHGYLVRTTLREMMEQGKVEAARKVGDSEGGIFISSVFQPAARAVGHVDGAYVMERVEPKVAHPKAEGYAQLLAKHVPGAGGWDEFIATGAKAAVPLQKARVAQTTKQIDFWIERILEKDPGNTLPAKVRARMDAIPEEELDKKLAAGRNSIANLKMRFVELEDPDAYAY